MEIKNKTRVWVTSIIIAWIFDQLYFRQVMGIWFVLFIFLCLAGGFFLAVKEKRYPARASLILLVPLIVFAVMTMFRFEPFTNVTNVLLSLGLSALLVLTFRGGRWPAYSLVDLIWGMFRLVMNVFIHPLTLLVRPVAESGAQPEEIDAKEKPKLYLSLARGILLALPVVALLGALLASADPVFAERLNGMLDFMRIDRLPEYILRLVYIIILAYILTGLYSHALTVSQEEKLFGLDKPGLQPFLGWIEAMVVFVAVDLLLASFIIVQFQYFFGGQTNIAIDGFTYAEYTRRGFSELVIVAFLSLLLFIVMEMVTRRSQGTQRRLFSVLGSLLVALVMVILVSAFQRLLLYENAYGFSRIRAVTHVFMIWLGILLAATAVIEALKHARLFPLMLLVSMIGFGITLNVLNVDSFIVRENVQRAQAGSSLDMQYLVSLSYDAVPDMVKFYTDESLGEDIRQDLGAALACRSAINEYSARQRVENKRMPTVTFPGYHVSRAKAMALLAQQQSALEAYPVSLDEDGVWKVQVDLQKRNCYFSNGMD